MYHAVIDADHLPAPDREEGAGLYDLPVAQFRAHMDVLSRLGYRTQTAGEAPDESEKFVILTFDDGEMNNAALALPILKSCGFKAYFFVTPERIGRPGYMDWPQLKHIREEGMTIGAHGLTHAVLPTMNDRDLENELRTSRTILQDRLAADIDAMSVPRGFYDRRVVDRAREAGYRHIFVSDIDPRCADGVTGRIAVKSGWTPARFEMALNGRVPSGEWMFDRIKNGFKRFLSPQAYNRLRQILVRKS